MLRAHKVKRIIDGKTYNTETSTRVAGWDQDEGPYDTGEYLYRTRFGAFFRYWFFEGSGEDDFERIEPLSHEEARTWLENKVSWNPNLIEAHFGKMPEAGSGEAKFTLRLPDTLRNRLVARAEENKQSLNAWIVRCLERCAEEPANPTVRK